VAATIETSFELHNTTGVSVDENRSELYCCLEARDSILVFDTTSPYGAVGGLTVGTQPSSCTPDESQSKLFVGDEGDTDQIVVVHTPSLTISNTIGLPSGAFPHIGDVLNDFLYVGLESINQIAKIHTPSSTLSATLSCGIQPMDVRCKGGRLYISYGGVAAGSKGCVGVIDLATFVGISNTITCDSANTLNNLAIDEGLDKAFIASDGKKIIVIHLGSETVSATITVGTQPWVAVDGTAHTGFVVHYGGDGLFVFSTDTDNVGTAFSIGGTLFEGVAVDETQSKAFLVRNFFMGKNRIVVSGYDAGC